MQCCCVSSVAWINSRWQTTVNQQIILQQAKIINIYIIFACCKYNIYIFLRASSLATSGRARSVRHTSTARATLGRRLIAANSLAKGAVAGLWYTRGCTVVSNYHTQRQSQEYHFRVRNDTFQVRITTDIRPSSYLKRHQLENDPMR